MVIGNTGEGWVNCESGLDSLGPVHKRWHCSDFPDADFLKITKSSVEYDFDGSLKEVAGKSKKERNSGGLLQSSTIFSEEVVGHEGILSLLTLPKNTVDIVHDHVDQSALHHK